MKKIFAAFILAFGLVSGYSEAAVIDGGKLTGGQMLHRGDDLMSSNRQYVLSLQAGDGNLVLRRVADGAVMWSNYKPGGDVAKVQEDNNFVVYKAGELLPYNAIWNTNTAKNVWDAGTRLYLDDAAGFLTLVNGGSQVIWTTKPAGTTPGCTTAREYAACVFPGTSYQFNTIVLACSVAEAQQQAAATGASYGACR